MLTIFGDSAGSRLLFIIHCVRIIARIIIIGIVVLSLVWWIIGIVYINRCSGSTATFTSGQNPFACHEKPKWNQSKNKRYYIRKTDFSKYYNKFICFRKRKFRPFFNPKTSFFLLKIFCNWKKRILDFEYEFVFLKFSWKKNIKNY